MRRWFLQGILGVMLASFLASSSLRSRINPFATGAVKRVILDERTAHNLETYQTASALSTATSRRSVCSPPRLQQQHDQEQDQERPGPYQQQFPYTNMASPEGSTAPIPVAESTSIPEPIATLPKDTPSADPDSKPEPELPRLSAADFRMYNRLAEMMDAYHNHFRHSWNTLYKTCTSGSRPAGMSLRAFLNTGLQLCQHLTIHHTIEEQHIFPELAERMPAFAAHDHLVSQHERIHHGLDRLEEYLNSCRSGERELRLSELKAVLDSFGAVLWEHLDDEVRMLGADNMRRYWTKAEIARFRW